MLEAQQAINSLDIPVCTCGECPAPRMALEIGLGAYTTLSKALGLFLEDKGSADDKSPKPFDWSTATQGMAFSWDLGNQGGIAYFMCNHPFNKDIVIMAGHGKIGLETPTYMMKIDLKRAPIYDFKV